VFIPNHHEGYISWAAYENNQALLANNANAKGNIVRGSIRRGSALLSGILRCGHCGAKLLVSRGTLFDSRVVTLFESALAAARSNSRDAICDWARALDF
jgi:hypothetical protein